MRRTRAGRKPWQPDKMHLHHRLLRLGHSHTRAVLLLYLWTAIGAFGVAVMAFIPVEAALVAGAVGIALALAITFGPRRFELRRQAALRSAAGSGERRRDRRTGASARVAPPALLDAPRSGGRHARAGGGATHSEEAAGGWPPSLAVSAVTGPDGVACD